MSAYTIESIFLHATQFPEALCAEVGPDLFFTMDSDRPGTRYGAYQKRVAKSICAQCTERVECLEYAIENDIRFGIFGGLDERERAQLVKSGSKPTHCIRGHEFTPENTHFDPHGYARCRQCGRELRSIARKKSAA